MVTKFSELGETEGCQYSLLQQKLSHNTALCVRKYVYEVISSTFFECATQINGGASRRWDNFDALSPKTVNLAW